MSTDLREDICVIGKSLFHRGFTVGSSGNISARLPDGGWLMTPTNVSMGDLDPAQLSVFDAHERHVGGPAPTKETFLHFAMYRNRSDAGAVVHLHSTHSVAVSMLDGIDPEAVLPPLTAYAVMRVGAVRLIPYFLPGDERLGTAVAAVAARHHAVLLANHGPVVAGRDLRTAQYAIEELEETAKLFLLLAGRPHRVLSPDQVAELKLRFGS
jgi:ribulose-5-phosphate 4-epimerase/fuculose-1-phosphate aldolase